MGRQVPHLPFNWQGTREPLAQGGWPRRRRQLTLEGSPSKLRLGGHFLRVVLQVPHPCALFVQGLDSTPRKPVSLWDLMKSFQLSRLTNKIADLQRWYDFCANYRNVPVNILARASPQKPSDDSFKTLLNLLEKLQKVGGEIDLEKSPVQLGLMLAHHKKQGNETNYSEWCGDLRNALDLPPEK